MFPVPLAIGWMMWQRHRWGLLVVLGWLLAGTAASAVLPTALRGHDTSPAPILIIEVLIVLLIYLKMVFSFGYDAVQVGARESCFPTVLFTLPVRTGALVGWPMAYGAAAVSLVWLITVWFVWRPWGKFEDGTVLPLWWPAMLAMAALAWIQALVWSPFPLRGLRIVPMVILIPALMLLAQFGASSGTSEGILVVLFGGLAAIGWTVGYLGVRQARRGDVPNWEAVFRPLGRLGRLLPRRRQPFASAARAQMWFEWRRTGNSLPLMTGMLLPFVLFPLFLDDNDVIPTARTLLSVLAVPVFMAGLAGAREGEKNPWSKDFYYGVTPYTATLPITTVGLVGAKLKAAAMSTLAAWLLVALAVPVAVVLTGHQKEVATWWQRGLREYQPFQLAAGLVACATLLIVWTWKHQVDGLFLGQAGRKWGLQVWLGMAGPLLVGVLGGWIYKHPETHETFRAMLPWLLGLLFLLKLLATLSALRQLLRRRLLKPRTALFWVMAWLLLASALFGLFAWVVPSEQVPLYYLAFAVVLAMPMTRLAASPLALAWNRHR